MLTKAVCFLRYKDDPNIVAMTALADAFERRDVDDTEQIIAGTSDNSSRTPHAIRLPRFSC